MSELAPNTVAAKFGKINQRVRDNSKRDLYFPPEGNSTHQLTEILVTDSSWSYKNPETGHMAGEDFDAIGIQFVFATLGDPEVKDGKYWRERRFDLPVFEEARTMKDGSIVNDWDELPDNQKTRIRIEEQRFHGFVARTLGLSDSEAKELDYLAALEQISSMIAAGSADGGESVVLEIIAEYGKDIRTGDWTYQRSKALKRISP